MNLDNNRQPLPAGYGRRFDYTRIEDDEEDVPVDFVEQDTDLYPTFKVITRTPLSDEINDWITETITRFWTFEREDILRGTYFCVQDDGDHVAVFKPLDEELGEAYNPFFSSLSSFSHNLLSRVLASQRRKGAAREIAAYLLDHPTTSERREGFVGPTEGFCRVPLTVPISCVHGAFNYGNDLLQMSHVWYKFGALQTLVENSGDCRGMYDDERLEDDDIQKICLLDMRFANSYRYLGNILGKVKDNGRYELIPIEHGCCFPDNFRWCYFGWLKWNKSKKKFIPEIVEYIESLDSRADIELLIRENFTMSYPFARTLAITTMLLKEGVKNGLSPFEIGHFMCWKLPSESDEDYPRVERAVSQIVGFDQLEEISALQKTVSESIEDLVGLHLGERYRRNMCDLELVEKDSWLLGLDMTKQQVEDELLQIVSTKLRLNIQQYANELRA